MKVSVVKPVPPPPPPNEIQLNLSIEEAKILRSILGGISCPYGGPFQEFISVCYDELGENGVEYSHDSEISYSPFGMTPVIREDATV
tara:strand:+ start:3190 stop:3450 length:261 start_codon:yes stop_codon:yes gene_type:complete